MFRLTVPNLTLSAVTLILWPSLARADVRVGSALVFKTVDQVELIPGVDVLFRRLRPAASPFIGVGGCFGMTA